jgi:uncharacterized metal-binding protein
MVMLHVVFLSQAAILAVVGVFSTVDAELVGTQAPAKRQCKCSQISLPVAMGEPWR